MSTKTTEVSDIETVDILFKLVCGVCGGSDTAYCVGQDEAVKRFNNRGWKRTEAHGTVCPLCMENIDGKEGIWA